MLGRANRMLARHVTAIATSFEPTKFLEGRARGHDACSTGNPVRDLVSQWAGADLSRAQPATAPFSSGVRRQPGCALLLRLRAAGSGPAAARRCAPACSSCSSAARRTLPGSKRPTVPPASRAAGDLFRQSARGNGQGPPRHRPLRGLHRGRADRHGPACDPCAAAARHRQRSAAAMRSRLAELGGAWCIEQKELYARAPGRRRSTACSAAPDRWRRQRPPQSARGGPMPSCGWPILVEELVGSRAKSA